MYMYVYNNDIIYTRICVFGCGNKNIVKESIISTNGIDISFVIFFHSIS